MAWPNWSRKTEPDSDGVVGLDLTSSRVRAVYGPADAASRVLPLDRPEAALPLAISLEHRTAEVGRAGIVLIRRLPHLVCRNYLPALGQAIQWRVAKRRVGPTEAIAMLAQRLRQPLASQRAIAVAIPAYLTVPQATLLSETFANAKLPVVGTTSTALAVAGTVRREFVGIALFVEADEHALTWTVLAGDGGQARVLATLTQPALSGWCWLDRMLNAVSDRCVRLCRRDPRDSADAEQTLFEQIDAALDWLQPGVPVLLQARTSQWYQELTFGPEELEQFCAPLARQAVDGMRQALAQAHAAAPAMARPDVLWLTADAARLPGLASALSQYLPESTAIQTLSANAVAESAHALASRWLNGELSRTHIDSAISLAGRLRLGSIAKPQAARPF